MIRALVVDDEELARRGLRLRLERDAGVTVIGECANGRAAITAIERDRPDLVLLDVQMPGLGGFDVVEAIGAERMPAVVFVTAYDEFALRAFDALAIDYLLKPIDDERFARALERVRRRLQERTESAIGRRMTALLRERQGDGASTLPDEDAPRPAAPPPPSPEAVRHAQGHVLVRDRGRVLILEIPEIDWIEADGDYVRVHAGGRAHLLRETMAAMERTLTPHRFARIHRSAIVNLSRVAELRPLTSREYAVVLRDGTRLRMSRRFRDRLQGVVGERI